MLFFIIIISGAGDKIPGGATLIFEVELLKIENKAEL